MHDSKPGLEISTFGLDETIDRFESSWSETIDLETFLPSPCSAADTSLLCELIRVDMELRWQAGLRTRVEDYLNKFPDYLLSKSELGNLAYEEFRLRRQSGEKIAPEQFARRLDLDVSAWPSWTRSASSNDTSGKTPVATTSPVDSGFPVVGESFHDLELVAVLGTGAFGTVFLARQSDLANRFIAVKITGINDVEPQTLARLQHTNIIPIHSLRRGGELQSICMPFLGLVTLQDVFRQTESGAVDSRSVQELISTVAGRRADTVVATTECIEKDVSEIKTILEFVDGTSMPALEGMNYEQTMLWIVGRIAEGLSFAHSRGIVHGDMKPGNVLISDEGQPLILDFHLSAQALSSDPAGLVGGTLPYMSARHLETLSGSQNIDESCDIFSLGVMLYQGLSGEFPYPYRGNDNEAIETMILDRSRSPRLVTQINPDISPGVASIVDHCLNPDRGYQTADQFRVDVDRHLSDYPLRFASNRSIAERTRKWIRRHPRLSSVSAMSLFGAVATALVAIIIGAKLNHAANLVAIQQSRQFVNQIQDATQPLTIGIFTSSYLDKNTDRLSSLLVDRKTFYANDEKNPGEPSLSTLPAEYLKLEKAAVVDARYWLARSLLTMGLNEESETRSRTLFERANAEIESAKSLSPASSFAFLQLQSDVYNRLGDSQRAADILKEPTSLGENRFEGLPNKLLRAAEFRRTGASSDALKILDEIVTERPDSFFAWLMMGHCNYDLEELETAVACYTVCIGLDHDSPWGYFCRGACHLANRNFQAAKSDFDRTLELNGTDTASHLNRGLAYQGLRKWNEAIRDVTFAIEAGCMETRAWFIRYQLFKRLGDQKRAAADLSAFLELVPKEEKSWNSRGLAQMIVNNPEAALADFRSALKANSRSIDAFQNIATVQAEYLGQTENAISALTEIIVEQPSNTVAVATRGVLFGRQSNRSRAHQDARLALRQNRSADTLYRVAGIYALTTKSHPHDSTIAIELLQKAALANGHLVLSRIKNDADLDPIRDQFEFKELIETLESWRQKTGSGHKH